MVKCKQKGVFKTSMYDINGKETPMKLTEDPYFPEIDANRVSVPKSVPQSFALAKNKVETLCGHLNGWIFDKKELFVVEGLFEDI